MLPVTLRTLLHNINKGGLIMSIYLPTKFFQSSNDSFSVNTFNSFGTLHSTSILSVEINCTYTTSSVEFFAKIPITRYAECFVLFLRYHQWLSNSQLTFLSLLLLKANIVEFTLLFDMFSIVYVVVWSGFSLFCAHKHKLSLSYQLAWLGNK